MNNNVNSDTTRSKELESKDKKHIKKKAGFSMRERKALQRNFYEEEANRIKHQLKSLFDK